MPYEQEKGYPKLSSDIHAVGMLAIQALTGILPNQFPRDANSLEIIWQDRVTVGGEFAIFLNKMVAYDFSERYQNATEALTAINSIIVSQPVSSPIRHPAPASQSLAKIYLSIFVTIILSLCLGIFVVYSLRSFEQPEPTLNQVNQEKKVW